MGFGLREGDLSTIGCGGQRCSPSDCCTEIFCSVNDGFSTGITSESSGGFQTSTCISEGGNSKWTLKSNQQSIKCENSDKKCTFEDCCDPPVTCGNNDGSETGPLNTPFSQQNCEDPSKGGGIGYRLKTQNA